MRGGSGVSASESWDSEYLWVVSKVSKIIGAREKAQHHGAPYSECGCTAHRDSGTASWIISDC